MLTGQAWAFADALTAADILPLRYAAQAPAEAARSLFGDLDPGLAARLAPGDVLVAGHGVGGGPGAEAAAPAIKAAGLAAVVVGSFATGFAEALLRAGVPALEVDAPAMFHTGQCLRLNLEGGTISNLSSGDRQPVRNLTEPFLERLRAFLGR